LEKLVLGKTTIINLINRFYEIQKGEILLDGINIKDINLRSLRKNIGIILQDPFIFARSIRDNIALNENLSDAAIIETLKLSSAESFITSLPNGIDEIAHERGSSFSAGQKQLIAFARIFAHNPSIFILDEATANIDTKTEELIQYSIDKISKNNLKKINIDKTVNQITPNKLDVISKINSREGDSLTVSEVSAFKEGTFPNGLSKYEKRHTNTVAPKWIPENCIECGRCSFVCPHAVIRSFITKEDQGIPYLPNKEYNYNILVSEVDCTECGLCINECPGKNGKKALEFGSISLEKQQTANKYFNNYNNPEIFNKFTVPGCSLLKPKFEFSGACAGCGETPYINLITRLFGDELVIANATGCSSIYGGSAPSTPYSIPWANSLFEDNAEFALGMHISYESKRNLVKKIMESEIDNVNDKVKEQFNLYINNMNDYKITNKVKQNLIQENIPEKLKSLLNYIPYRTVLAIGGDGWAYDIGFGGLDHVLSTNENIKVLVLDTEVYSNTGGQSSKSSKLGQVSEFADFGKKTTKKDLFRIAMSYPNCYVASISLGANMMHAIKVMKEAMEHNGPSLIIAYSPCIEHGIKTGMSHSIEEEKLASEVGYTLLMRYNPTEEKLYLDNKEPNFDNYEKFLDNEVRYNALKIKDKDLAEYLLTKQIEYAKKRYNYYKKLSTE